jgi:hypothetical protein
MSHDFLKTEEIINDFSTNISADIANIFIRHGEDADLGVLLVSICEAIEENAAKLREQNLPTINYDEPIFSAEEIRKGEIINKLQIIELAAEELVQNSKNTADGRESQKEIWGAIEIIASFFHGKK